MALNWRTVDPLKLRPRFRQDIETLGSLSPYAWVVTHGYRSLAEQDALWQAYQAGGPKAAPAGKSPHNYGMAVDLCLDGSPLPGLQPDWNVAHEGWHWLFSAIFEHPRLHSGRSFSDADHVESANWKAQR